MKKIVSKFKFVWMVIILFLLSLVFSNTYLSKLYNPEKNDINALIPNLSEDYYTRQLSLTKLFQNKIENRSEFKEFSRSIEQLLQITDVPLVLQNPEYPNGCEAASAVMLLQYFGIDITLKNFIDNYLWKNNVYVEDGKLFGPDPSIYYAGDPTETRGGWGVFEPGIKLAMEKVIAEKSNQLWQVEESEIKYPLYIYSHTVPFMIWITTGYEEVKDVHKWYSYDGKKTFIYPKNSHAVVVTGMDEQYYYINDPLKIEKNIPVEKTKLEKSFDSLGRQVIQLQLTFAK